LFSKNPRGSPWCIWKKDLRAIATNPTCNNGPTASELAFSPYQTRGQLALGRGIFKDLNRKSGDQRNLLKNMSRPATTREALPEWPEWLDLRTLEHYCCTSERTLRDHINREHNPLPARRVGGKLFVSRRAFDLWMESQPEAARVVDLGGIVDEIVSAVRSTN
jgi:hypothetical protein